MTERARSYLGASFVPVRGRQERLEPFLGFNGHKYLSITSDVSSGNDFSHLPGPLRGGYWIPLNL